MNPIRVLELRSTYGDGGGPDKTILLSARQHNPAQFVVHCLYLRSQTDSAFSIGRRARELGVSFEEVLENGPFDRRALRSVMRRLLSFRPHIVHTHDYKTDLLGLLIRPFLPRAALLATAHGWTQDNARMNLYNQLDRRALRHFDRVIAVSDATRLNLVQAGVRLERLSVLHNGIDTQTWRPGDRAAAAEALRTAFALPRGTRLVGFIGRLSPEKDVPTALAVMSQVVAALPDVHFLIVGDGAFAPQLPGEVEARGLSGRVHILGQRRTDRLLYQGLDAYLMTSRTEGLPNTLLEAMACGCPSVATAVGGIPELVGDPPVVPLRPPGDVDGLASSLIKLLSWPEEAAALGRLSRARIEDAFSFEERLERIEGIYRQLAESRR